MNLLGNYVIFLSLNLLTLKHIYDTNVEE